MEDIELLAREIRSVPDSELGKFRELAPALWSQEISHRFPAKTREEMQVKAGPVIPPQPAPQPQWITRDSVNGILHGFARCVREKLKLKMSRADFDSLISALLAGAADEIKQYVETQLAPILQRLEALEAHSERSMDERDALSKRVSALDIRMSAQTINARHIQ